MWLEGVKVVGPVWRRVIPRRSQPAGEAPKGAEVDQVDQEDQEEEPPEADGEIPRPSTPLSTIA